MTRLVDLHPTWVGAGGEGVTGSDGKPVPRREAVGISFDCLCGCGGAIFVQFQNPLDGGPPHDLRPSILWQRTGDTFETLTLRPSILFHPSGSCRGWHGFITDGNVLTC